MSKTNLEKRVEGLEGQSGAGEGTYVLKVSMWEPDDHGGEGGVVPFYWLMQETPDGRGERIRSLTPEEKETYEQTKTQG